MTNKHVWSKEVHPDLKATPRTYSVMAHGIPKTFDISKQANLNLFASENSFQALELTSVFWMGLNQSSAKKALLGALFFQQKSSVPH
jgi:hypothetical protein